MAEQKYLKRLSDYAVIPATEFLIEPYVPLGGLIFVAGKPKTFKSYLSGIDWGYSVARGCQWLGRPTKKGRVLYFALESYHGVLRRAEAWRLFHKHSKADVDGLAYVTDRISFAEKTCTADQHFTKLFNANYRPDLVIFDTWFKVTAGAGTAEQTDMSVALKNLRSFQDRLTEWKVEGGLPAVTFVVIAHTTYKGDKLFGSITQFADCDGLYQLERAEHANQATLVCVGARDIEEPPAITFEMEKVPIVTAKGNEQNLVVSKEVPAADTILNESVEETRQSKQEAKQAAKEASLDELAYRTLVGFWRGPQNWTGFNEWFEATKAARGETGLGPGTFTKIVNRLMAAERVRKSVPDGLYQVVLGEDREADREPISASLHPSSTSTSASDFSPLRGREVPEVRSEGEGTSGSASGSARSARSNSTEGRNDQNPVVPPPSETEMAKNAEVLTAILRREAAAGDTTAQRALGWPDDLAKKAIQQLNRKPGR